MLKTDSELDIDNNASNTNNLIKPEKQSEPEILKQRMSEEVAPSNRQRIKDEDMKRL